ncbi:hypothetical protein HDU96_005040 [Phlyctochytrium bullatum]|nr:hypothetical protein HDU96_005040 [Phlyctochytrium bullatum]
MYYVRNFPFGDVLNDSGRSKRIVQVKNEETTLSVFKLRLVDKEHHTLQEQHWSPILEWGPDVPKDVKAIFLNRATFPRNDLLTVDPSSSAKIKVNIFKIQDEKHPAFGQFGLIAKSKIPPRTYILDYCGVIHTEPYASKTSHYILSFERIYSLSIDAEKAGNEARMINDYRGVPGAVRPNVEFQTYRNAKTGEIRMGIFSLSKPIRAGEELLLSYGKGFWNQQDSYSIEDYPVEDCTGENPLIYCEEE